MAYRNPARNLVPNSGTDSRATRLAESAVLTTEKLEFVRTLLQHNHADNTKQAYQESLRYFWGWAAEALGMREHYPVTVDTVLRFIADHLGSMDSAVEQRLIARGIKSVPGPHSLRTVEMRLLVLGIAHNVRELENPFRSKIVKKVLKNARRTLGDTSKRKNALTIDLLEELLGTCERNLTGRRDRALLLVGFASGGRRRSELTALEFGDLTKIPDGYILRLRRSKTDQMGEGKDVPLLGKAADALDAWLKAAGITGGKIFRGILPGGKLSDSISGRQVARIVKQRAMMAGLDPSGYSAHSLRSGFMTSAGRRGIHLAEAMQMSGHRNLVVAYRYYRTGDVINNPAAWLFEREPKTRTTTKSHKK